MRGVPSGGHPAGWGSGSGSYRQQQSPTSRMAMSSHPRLGRDRRPAGDTHRAVLASPVAGRCRQGQGWLIQMPDGGNTSLSNAHPLSKHSMGWIREGCQVNGVPRGWEWQVNTCFGPSLSWPLQPAHRAQEQAGSSLRTPVGFPCPPAMHKASSQRGAEEEAPSPGSQLTLKRDDGEVLCRLGLAGGEALVGTGVALLGSRDEEGLVADAPDGDVIIHRHQVCVAVPADDVLGGPTEGTREDDGAADACFELLWCEGHTQRVCERGERRWRRQTVQQEAAHPHCVLSAPPAPGAPARLCIKCHRAIRQVALPPSPLLTASALNVSPRPPVGRKGGGWMAGGRCGPCGRDTPGWLPAGRRCLAGAMLSSPAPGKAGTVALVLPGSR